MAGDWDQLVDELERMQARNRELERRLAELVDAVDAGAVEMRSSDITPTPGAEPHPWHEEWLSYVRRLLDDGKN